MGGAVSYLTNLLRHLPPPASGHQFLVILPPRTAEEQKDLAPNIKLFPTAVGDAGGWKRFWWDQVTLRRFLKQEKADALFSTANFGMLRCPVAEILLIQNALYFSPAYEEMLLSKHGLKRRIAFKLRRWLICRSVKNAGSVIVPTQALLDALRSYTDVPAGKAFVSPYGISAPRADRSSDREPGAGPTVQLLYVSLYTEHKNLRTLLEALPLVNGEPEHRFILTTTVNPTWPGAAWTLTWKGDLELSRRPEVAPWVKFVGPLASEQTRQLYAGADIFVFPSLVESFGYPMVEAMAAGLPIVAADTPTNREICGQAAVYFSPLSPEDLAQQIQRLAADTSRRAQMRTAGRERAATHFRWEQHVRRLLERVEALARDTVASDPGALEGSSSAASSPCASATIDLEARPSASLNRLGMERK